MSISQSQRRRPLTTVESTAISFAYWIVFLSATAMYAILALAPVLSEHRKLLQAQFELNQQSELRRTDIRHFQRVVDAIRTDPEFVERLADKEFSTVSVGRQKLHLGQELGYDARVPQQVFSSQRWQARWYDETLAKLATAGSFRSTWSFGTLTLFLFAFICLNDFFFSRAFGRFVLNCIENLGQRYRLPVVKLD